MLLQCPEQRLIVDEAPQQQIGKRDPCDAEDDAAKRGPECVIAKRSEVPLVLRQVPILRAVRSRGGLLRPFLFLRPSARIPRNRPAGRIPGARACARVVPLFTCDRRQRAADRHVFLKGKSGTLWAKCQRGAGAGARAGGALGRSQQGPSAAVVPFDAEVALPAAVGTHSAKGFLEPGA